MRKIDEKYENIIDNLLIKLSDFLCPYFKCLNFTPNYITTLSLIFGLISIYYFIKQKFKYAAICFFISYFFDVMDGHYARKYNQVTKYGDIYDHVKDIVIYVTLLILFIYNNNYSNSILIILLIIWILLLLCSAIHLGLQEKIYDKDESQTLSFLKNIINNNENDKELICKTKICSLGTFILFTCSIIFFNPKKN